MGKKHIVAPPLSFDTPAGNMDINVEAVKDATMYINHSTGYDLQDRQIDEFIEENIESKQLEYCGRSYIEWAYSLMEVLDRHYEVKRIANYNGRGSAEANPVYLDEKIRVRGEEEKVIKIPHRQCRFMNHREDGHPLVISFYPYDTYEIDIRLYFSTTSAFNHTAFMDEVTKHFKTEGIFKNAIINADYTFLKLPELSWDDIVLTEDQRSMLDRHALTFLKRLNKYKDVGMRTSRGLLLLGPPGTGKTLCCSILINLCQNCTIVYVSRNAISERGQIDEIYSLARLLAPSLVVVEDIDTLGGLDREMGDHPLLGEFLNCLAGVENNEGVITLATTNYSNRLDQALADRPGRFDVRINFKHPDASARRLILEKYLDKCNTGGLNLRTLVKKTEGWSGAYLRELVNIAIMVSTDHDDVITQEILEEAFKELGDMRDAVAKERGQMRDSSEGVDRQYYQ